jgi:hypothetical protein
MKLFGVFGGKLSFTQSQIYTGITGGLDDVIALSGLITAVMATFSLASATGLSIADKTAKSIALTGDYLSASGGAISGAGSLVKTAASAAGTASHLAVAGSAIGIVAGSVKVIASGIQYGREKSSEEDLVRAGRTLSFKDARGELTENEKTVKRFLSHEKRESARRKDSAGVGIALGGQTALAGVFALTGLAPVGAALGLLTLVSAFRHKLEDMAVQDANRKLAVDEYLDLNGLIEKLRKDHPQDQRFRGKITEEVKEEIRCEALAMQGFSSYQDCFRHICIEFASVLYDQEIADPDPGDDDMYMNALKSLGMKIDTEAGKPTVAAIATRIMS